MYKMRWFEFRFMDIIFKWEGIVLLYPMQKFSTRDIQ